MSDTLTLAKRDQLGSRASQRLRAAGQLPVVLYGHKEAVEHLTASTPEVRKAVAHHAQMVNLTGDASGQALVKAVQWDTFHRELLHVDLQRVDASEKVTATIVLELKGEASGAGVIEQTIASVEVEGPANKMPEVLHVDISKLQLGDNATLADILDLPAGVKPVAEASTVVAHCVRPADAPDMDSVAASGESPEVISKGGGEEAEG
ncbi:MAG: 50S ribosomal protein L25 [Planctomycetota bacterium]